MVETGTRSWAPDGHLYKYPIRIAVSNGRIRPSFQLAGRRQVSYTWERWQTHLDIISTQLLTAWNTKLICR